MFEKKITADEKKVMEKEAKKAEKGKKKLKKDGGDTIGIKAVVVPLILAAIVVCLIYIVMQNQEASKVIETTMVTAEKTIPGNTFIKKDEVEDYFKVITVDSTKVPENIYTSIEELPDGFYVENAMIEKQPVFTDDIAQKDEVMDKYTDGTTTTSIAVDAFNNSVSGTLRKGDVVDIYAVDPSSEALTLQVEKVYIEAAYDSSGEVITDAGTAVAFTIRVAPNETELVNTAIAYGGIQLYLTKE